MYNDSGKRIRKTVNGVTTDFYLDGSAILMQTSSDGSRIDFFYDDKGNVFAMKYQNEMYFYRKNLFGDILGILDSHGTELVKYEYNSWGKLLNLTDYSSNGLGRRNPFRFKGYYYDEELGMYYLNSRYYDPETGRMLSPDVLEVLVVNVDSTAKNLYLYCDSNPIQRKDDDGKILHCVLVGAASAAFGMITTIATNIVTDEKWNDGLVEVGASSFVSGALSVSGFGPLGSAVGQAIGQGVIAGITEGYSLWKKSKTGGITAWDVTNSVINVGISISGGTHYQKKDSIYAKGKIRCMRNRIRDYNKAKAGGKRGVIARRKAELDRETKKLGEMVYKHSKPDWTSSLLNVVNNVVSGSQPVDKPKGGGKRVFYMRW